MLYELPGFLITILHTLLSLCEQAVLKTQMLALEPFQTFLSVFAILPNASPNTHLIHQYSFLT